METTLDFKWLVEYLETVLARIPRENIFSVAAVVAAVASLIKSFIYACQTLTANRLIP